MVIELLRSRHLPLIVIETGGLFFEQSLAIISELSTVLVVAIVIADGQSGKVTL